MTVSLDILDDIESPARRGRVCAIAIDRLTVRYPGDVVALREVSLEIDAGTHVVVLGASGSGKTTLLGTLSGRVPASAGRLDVEGAVASIHQDLRLVKQRSALGNVLDGAAGRYGTFRAIVGYPKHEKQRAIALLTRVGLQHRIRTAVWRLSGGERQRVAIARALMQDPKILLADEPVASLDSANAHSVMRLLCELQRERGLTLVSVLHDCDLAETYGDRIIGFDQGEFVHDQEGTSCRQTGQCAGGQSHRSFRERQACGACAKIENATHRVPEPASVPSKWRTRGIGAGMAIAVVALYAFCIHGLQLMQSQPRRSASAILDFAQQMIPSAAQWAAIDWSVLFISLLKTMQMAVIGTTIAVLIAWPMSALAARNTGPWLLRLPARLLLNAIRAVPSIVWAVLFVGAVGIGEEAGIWALVAYSLGYLTKFFYEAFEAVDPGPPDALREIGAGGLVRFLRGVWPASRAAVLSSSLFMLEYNVRAASVLGIVGAGGIGFDLMVHKDYGNWHVVGAIVLLLVAVVLVLDAISSRLRSILVRSN